ncbi:hypothetical protein BC443_07205 [Salinicola sp. MIT1003]|nr:hypothetical protein BC443_07205 [Salinicola sp. MIT1003]
MQILLFYAGLQFTKLILKKCLNRISNEVEFEIFNVCYWSDSDIEIMVHIAYNNRLHGDQFSDAFAAPNRRVSRALNLHWLSVLF